MGGHTGLSDAEAHERLRRDGPNELRVTQGSSVLHALAALAREPLFMLLFAAAGIYLWLGDRTEALALVASAVVAATITVYQKYRTERVLVALRDLSSPRAVVLRGGQPRRIASREVVVGDLLLLREGDRVPADASVLQADNLLIDESLLTGESVAVHKFAGAKVSANTLVTAGQAQATVTATGARTEFGLIGSSLMTLRDARTPLQRDTAQLARWFGGAGALLSLALVVGHGLLQGEWIEGLLRGLTLAMAILPEEFPLVITVFMALGAWRLAQQQVLTRRPGAIEALGAASVLCVDKTGTLTVNRMRLARALPRGASADAPHALAEATLMACEPQPFDPMEQACLLWAADQHASAPPPAQLQRRYPLREDRLVVGHAWAVDGAWRLAAKGAPEHVLALCSLSPAERDEQLARVQAMAADGLRVLGVARAACPGTQAPADLADVALDFVGLVGFEDPVRPEVPQAVADCRRAGIRILMITGDYPLTAAAIARTAGIAAAPQVVTGDELAAWDDATLAERLRGIDVVARAKPLLKLRLVQALQGAGEVVAMTGDGVNDAPALRAAHIGVAMGERGSDVAREAASLVLLRDDFGSLVAAVRHGRHIFANLRQALLYVLAVHVPMIGASVLPLLIGAPPLLLPLHVMFLEFVIDPACSLAFEAERGGRDPMDAPPRPVGEHVLGRRHIVVAMVQGLIALGAVVATYALGAWQGASHDALRTACVSAIVLMNLVLIVHDRSSARDLRQRLRGANPVLWALVAGTLAAWSLVLALPALRTLFKLDTPTPAMLLWLLPSVLLAVLALEGFRHGDRRPARVR